MRGQRTKLSTTVAPETSQYLEQMVRSGSVANLAEAVDTVVSRVRRLENRRRLSLATRRYFEGLSPEAVSEENELGRNMASASAGIDFDEEL